MTCEVDMALQFVLVDGVEAVVLHRQGNEVLIANRDGVKTVVESFRVVPVARKRMAQSIRPQSRREKNRRK